MQTSTDLQSEERLRAELAKGTGRVAKRFGFQMRLDRHPTGPMGSEASAPTGCAARPLGESL